MKHVYSKVSPPVQKDSLRVIYCRNIDKINNVLRPGLYQLRFSVDKAEQYYLA